MLRAYPVRCGMAALVASILNFQYTPVGVQRPTTARKPPCTIAIFGLPQWKIQRGVPFAGTHEPGSINRSRNCRFDTAVKRAKKRRTVALVGDSIVQDTARFHRKWRIKSSCGIKGVITHKSFLNGEFAPFSRLNERRLIYHIFERVGASYCQKYYRRSQAPGDEVSYC